MGDSFDAVIPIAASHLHVEVQVRSPTFGTTIEWTV